MSAEDPIYKDASDNILLRRILGRLTSLTTSGGMSFNSNGLTNTELRAAPVVVAGTTPRVTASFSRPADATQYSIGDIIANSGTAASVVPITFNLPASSGRLTGARAVVTAASGTIVLPAFDLILFRPEASIPFANAGYPADNTALNITSAAYNQVVAIFSFSASSWRNQAGGTTAAGGVVYQAVSLASRAIAPFNVDGLSDTLLGLVQAQNTWNPGAVANTLSFMLDSDFDV